MVAYVAEGRFWPPIFHFLFMRSVDFFTYRIHSIYFFIPIPHLQIDLTFVIFSMPAVWVVRFLDSAHWIGFDKFPSTFELGDSHFFLITYSALIYVYFFNPFFLSRWFAIVCFGGRSLFFGWEGLFGRFIDPWSFSNMVMLMVGVLVLLLMFELVEDLVPLLGLAI